MEKKLIRGLLISDVTLSEAIELSDSLLREKSGTATVFTPNAEIAQAALESPELAKIINSATLCLPDGAGILKAASILKTPLRSKVAGVDYGLELMKLCAERGEPVWIFGGKPGTAMKAAERLTARLPGLKIVGTSDGYSDNTPENISNIAHSGARALLVCLGAPRQEIWAHENLSRLGEVRLVACLGGSVDIYAGVAKRAPALFVRARLEWLWRLILEPKRIVRMMKIPKYLLGACKERRQSKKNKAAD